MKVYIEARETRALNDPILPEQVRIEVTEHTEAQRMEILAALKDVMSDIPTVVFTLHSCGHEEYGSCSEEVI